MAIFGKTRRFCIEPPMLAIEVLLMAILWGAAAVSAAEQVDMQLVRALEQYRAGDFDAALQVLAPLLETNDLDQQTAQSARQLAARVLHARGEQHFREARIAESIADFDREIQLAPERAPEHWQRGIAYYYAGEYDKGARQFELHRTVNPQDVENAAWHFLCVVRAPEGSVDAARKSLIPVDDDSRVPMAQIQQMFAGSATPEDVLKAGERANGTAKFYADLYVGLYYEALRRGDESLRLVEAASINPAAKDSYMGDVARVHVKLRKQISSANRNAD